MLENRGAIEDAATQVTRGLNGLIEYFGRHRRYVPENYPVKFIPAIFTTARVWSSDVDLTRTDAALGQVDLGDAQVKQVPWLWLQYHVSPGLQHSVDRNFSDDDRAGRPDLGRLLELEFARTIAVVGSGGIDAFLASQLWTF